MIRAYDDSGNIVDLVEWEKQIRAEEREKTIDEVHQAITDKFEKWLWCEIDKSPIYMVDSIIDGLKAQKNGEIEKTLPVENDNGYAQSKEDSIKELKELIIDEYSDMGAAMYHYRIFKKALQNASLKSNDHILLEKIKSEKPAEQKSDDLLSSISKGLDEFKDLERKMTQYFEMVDISSEKTELEKLALDIVCNGMQTIGFLIDELSEEDIER